MIPGMAQAMQQQPCGSELGRVVATRCQRQCRRQAHQRTRLSSLRQPTELLPSAPCSSGPWKPAACHRRRQRQQLPPAAAAASHTEQQPTHSTQNWATPQPQHNTDHAHPTAQGGPAAAAPRRVGLPPPVERVPQYKMPKEPMSEFGYSKNFNDKYELEAKIGKGASCTVHVALDRATGERVAVKVMPKRLGPDGFLEKGFARRVRNEVDIAMHLGRSLNVCYFHGAYESDAAVQLVLEQLTGGMLWDRVNTGKYTERQAARIVRDVMRTIAQCHSKNIMMRDIKPQNFMFATPADDSPLKAVDFGISVFCKPGQYLTTRAGTRIVMAPEVVRERYTLSADLWSAGVMAYLLLTGRLPFPFWDRMYVQRQAVTEKEMYADITHAPLDFESPPWDALSDDARDFVQSLLQREEMRRPTAEEALQHRWLAAEELQRGDDVPLSGTIVQRLQRFGTYGRLKQAALRTVASHVPQDDIMISEMRGLFLELDPLDSGRVPYTRLQQELEEGAFNLSPKECQQLLAQMSLTQDGYITFKEFLASLVDWNKLQETGQWQVLVDRAFAAMDVDGCGRIGPKDLERLLCGEEGCEGEDWLDATLREADVKHVDQHIEREEFRRLMGAQLGDKLHLFDQRLDPSKTKKISSTGSLESVNDSMNDSNLASVNGNGGSGSGGSSDSGSGSDSNERPQEGQRW